MTERWEEKTKACSVADGKAAEARRRANELYAKNVALIEAGTQTRAERDAYKALALGGAVTSVTLLLFILLTP